jgi:hypothetical protein
MNSEKIHTDWFNSIIKENSTKPVDSNKDIINNIQQLYLVSLDTIYNSLKNYKFIENISDLNIGSYIFWFNKTLSGEKKLFKLNGGFVINKKILIKTHYKRFLQLNFNNFYIFQKLTEIEYLVKILEKHDLNTNS